MKRNSKPSPEAVNRNRELQKKADEYKKNLRARMTPSEKHLKTLLDKFVKSTREFGVYRPKYKFQKAFYKSPLFCIVDFWFPTTRCCIEVDGGYHYTEKGIAKDKWRDSYLFIRGVNVFHVTNEIVMSWGYDDLLLFLEKNSIAGKLVKPEKRKPATYLK